MSSLKDISDALLNSDKILLASHENPDYDALGSMLALATGLKSLGKDVNLYNSGNIPNHLKFLPDWEIVNNDLSAFKDNYDLFVLLDCTDIYRPGKSFGDYINNYYEKELKRGSESGSQKNKLMIIDHHNTNSSDTGLTLIDVDASSTGILVYKLLQQLHININKNIADCLLSTIIGDTGSYRYSNTNSEALRISGELLEAGADLTMITRAIYENEPLKKIKLVSEALNTLEVDETKKIASVYVDESMYKKTDTTREDTEGIVNILRSIDGVSVAIFYKQDYLNGNKLPIWKVSLRSKYDVDVSKIAKSFGGGGHIKAAGFSIEGSIKNVKNEVLQSVKKVI
ncbi:MAG: DHH family phosphoesterase [Thermodesulfobacteriota bacterium]